MKVSEQWLREWVNPDIDSAALGERLTFAGVELDGIEKAASDFTNVVIGKIISVDLHPNADRLRVCQVNVGEDDALQIVTNVSDVKVGQCVPVALVGANLPDESGKPFKIKKGKLRGVASYGMFCGGDTLGMPGGKDGLLVLPDDAPIGMSLRDFLLVDDVIFDFDMTPNRADCNSIRGMAREVGVLTESPVKEWPIETAAVQHANCLSINVIAQEGCPRYAGRLINDSDANIETPLWMREKLRRSGLKSLSFLVDVTNYVLMELGQPMHVFDADKIVGGIQVRFAHEKEKLTLLDGQTLELDSQSLVIADDEKAIALAGIMGGLETSVTSETTAVFLESAYFDPKVIAGKARGYGLHTDSSYRFERGVSPDLQVMAIERATDLITRIAGGNVGVIKDIQTNKQLQRRKVINLRRKRISRVLGLEFSDNTVERILTALGCEIVNIENGWQVKAPLFRFDIVLEVDLIEELARIKGYDKIPSRLRALKPMMALPQEKDVTLNDLQDILVHRGYQETVSYSFVSKEVEQLLSGCSDVIELINPISADLSVMRSSLWAGLVKTAVYNQKRQQSRLRLFESGLTFIKEAQGLTQRKKIAGLISGDFSSVQWSERSRLVDFYDIKADVEALLSGVEGRIEFIASDIATLHPGQSASICLNGQTIGHLGMLHPQLEKKLQLSKSVFVFEMDVDQLIEGTFPSYKTVSIYPSIQRDIALIVDKDITYDNVKKVIDSNSKEHLINSYLFDIYEGESVPKGRKSLAISLIFKDDSRTLKDSEVTVLIDNIIAALSNDLNATLRE